jgi:hypothetical protein
LRWDPSHAKPQGVADKKTTVLAIRVTDTDKAALEADAKRRGMPLASLARDLLLARQSRENSVKPLESPNIRVLRVYHIDDLGDDALRHFTPSLRK